MLNSTKNCLDQEELQLTKTHMMIQQRSPPLTHHPYYDQKLRHQKRLKPNKAPGEDNITEGILSRWRRCYDPSSHWSIQHMSASSTGPKAWKNALIILIHKKRNKLDIKITEQSACFPLCTRCFQTFFYKGEFIRCTSTNRVSKPDLGRLFKSM